MSRHGSRFAPLVALRAACLALICCACSSASPARVADPHTQRQVELEAVRDTVTRVTHEIDAKRWDELRALYADRVATDYTSLFGGKPVEQGGDELIAGWKGVLSRVTTHHQLGPISVSLAGGRATAVCQVRGFHHADGAPGGADWEVLGLYVFELGKTAAGTWKIDEMTLVVRAQTGNTKLLSEANAR